MKKIILALITLLLPICLQAQASTVDRVFDKYSGKLGYTSVMVTKSMFELFSTLATDETDKEFTQITSQLNCIKILSCEDSQNANTGLSFYKDVVTAINAHGYQDLMTVKEGGNEIKFIIKKTGHKISEFIMVVGGKEACLIYLQGDIDLKQVAKLSKSMNLKGFDHLNNINNKPTK